MVGGMVVTIVDREYDDAAWRCAVVLFRARVVVLSAFVVDAAGGAADQLLSLLKAQR